MLLWLQGQGFCQQGFFCGAPSKRGGPPPALRCLPAPKDCGLAGKPCCPSNLLTRHTRFEDWACSAFCKDGSVCFEFEQKGQLTDWYKGNTGMCVWGRWMGWRGLLLRGGASKCCRLCC